MAKRAFDRLVDERQAVILYATVRQYVKARRTKIVVNELPAFVRHGASLPIEWLARQALIPHATEGSDLFGGSLSFLLGCLDQRQEFRSIQIGSVTADDSPKMGISLFHPPVPEP
jgi:hypothetical protein